TKSAPETNTKIATKLGDNVPAGRARDWVRGFAPSMEASARRLNAIAAERAATIATTIQNSWRSDGAPPAASMAPDNAKGRAKIECSHLIISSVVRKLGRSATTEIVNG